MNQREYLKQMRWEGIKNASGETCPPFGLLAITGSEQRGTEYKRTVLLGDMPSTTFYRDYAINGPTAIPAGKYGRCTRMCGGLWIAYDSGTPAAGEGWGPKPGQWTASKGFPGITVEGIKSSDRKLLLGTLGEIRTILCKAVAQNAAGSLATDVSDYKIYAGTAGSETDAGFTTVPAIYSRGDTMINEWFYATLRNGVWYAELEDNSWLGKADSAISAGSSGTISLWTGTAGSETDSGLNATSIYNRTSVDIPSGGWVHIMRVNGKFYCEPWSC
jgi:hypothetical protein